MKPSTERRRAARVFVKVIHRHRVGGRIFRRVSELVYVGGHPKAVLSWMDVGGLRTPVYLCDLDETKLRQVAGAHNRHTFYYDEVTTDPRFEPIAPLPGNAPRQGR